MKKYLFIALFLAFFIYGGFSTPPNINGYTPKLGDYYNGSIITETSKYESYFEFNDPNIYSIRLEYIPASNSLTTELLMSQKYYSEDRSDFAFYCAILNFIENSSHYYESYYTIFMTTEFNYNDEKIVKRIYKYKLIPYSLNE